MSNLQEQDKKDPKRLPVVIRIKILFGAAFLFPFNLYQTHCLSSICDLPRNTSIVKRILLIVATLICLLILVYTLIFQVEL